MNNVHMNVVLPDDYMDQFVVTPQILEGSRKINRPTDSAIPDRRLQLFLCLRGQVFFINFSRNRISKQAQKRHPSGLPIQLIFTRSKEQSVDFRLVSSPGYVPPISSNLNRMLKTCSFKSSKLSATRPTYVHQIFILKLNENVADWKLKNLYKSGLPYGMIYPRVSQELRS